MSDQFKEETGLPKFILALFVIQFVFFIFYGLSKSDDKSIIYFSVGFFALGIFLAFVRLGVEINEERIKYKFFPFFNKSIDWNEIKDVEIVKISALSDFLGWGIRFSRKYGWSYITNSEYGLFIKKNNERRIILSIRNKDKLIKFFNKNNCRNLPVIK